MKVLLLAGEESGMLYARALRERLAGDEVRTYADYGFETSDLAVFGIFPVLLRLPFFLRVARTMKRAIDAWRPDVVCTIDYPGLNLRLAAHAKRRGIRAVHVVCPQVWAWKQGRIPKIERALDALCCFFPFEPKLFSPGFATFVGHPLVRDLEGKNGGAGTSSSPQEIVADKCPLNSRGGEDAAAPLVALLPGSRAGEITRILPEMLAAARQLARRFPDVRFEIPAANARAESLIRALAAASVRRDAGAPPRLAIRRGGAREILAAARCAVVASGTATLEAALLRCPTVLVYRVGPVLAWIARRVIKGTRYVGLANVIWDRCRADRAETEPPMPELLQEDFTAAAVAAHVARWLSDDAARAEAAARLDRAVRLLDAPGDPLANVVGILRARIVV